MLHIAYKPTESEVVASLAGRVGGVPMRPR
jgi:hypothetical protein